MGLRLVIGHLYALLAVVLAAITASRFGGGFTECKKPFRILAGYVLASELFRGHLFAFLRGRSVLRQVRQVAH